MAPVVVVTLVVVVVAVVVVALFVVVAVVVVALVVVVVVAVVDVVIFWPSIFDSDNKMMISVITRLGAISSQLKLFDAKATESSKRFQIMIIS